ncbi:MAG: endo-1,3-alpha-glucanase family glycosylhydrolase, partial [Planctomycetota bacterium]
LARPARPDADWRIQDAEWDIRLAQAIGVDGFWFNLSQGAFDHTDYWPAFIEYLTATERLKSGFTIAPNIDFASGEQIVGTALADKLVEYLQAHGKLDSPALQRIGGKLVVTSFAANRASAAWWKALRTGLSARGERPFTVICSLPWQADTVRKYDEVADAFADWGIRNAERHDYDAPDRFGGVPSGKPAVAMVRGFDVRYKRGGTSFWESRGSRTLREHWMAAINSKRVNWAQLLTWNDHGEDTSFVPNTGKQFAVYDLAAYYIAWFKTGQQPPITKDALYYFHRILPTEFVPLKNRLDTQPRKDSPPPVNEIELLAFLTQPGTLQIETSGGVFTGAAPAGISTFTAPLPTSGKPVFRLLRGEEKVIEIQSAFAVQTSHPQDDLVYRAGGSLRTIYGQSHPATAECQRSPTAAELAMGEPVWLAR